MQARLLTITDRVKKNINYVYPTLAGGGLSFVAVKIFDGIAGHAYTLNKLIELTSQYGCGWGDGKRGLFAYCPNNNTLSNEITQQAYAYGDERTAADLQSYSLLFTLPLALAAGGTVAYGTYRYCSNKNKTAETQALVNHEQSNGCTEKVMTGISNFFGIFANKNSEAALELSELTQANKRTIG